MANNVIKNNSGNRFLGQIAQYASVKYQVRYALYATKDSYILLDDMINDYHDFNLKKETSRLISEGKMSKENAEEILSFHSFLSGQYDKVNFSKDNAYIIFNDPAWINIRKTAKTLLQKNEFDLVSWEDRNVEPFPPDSSYIKLIEEIEKTEKNA